LTVIVGPHPIPIDGLLRDEGGVSRKCVLEKGPVGDLRKLFAIIIAVTRNGKVT
jgi:hypothetical protein